MVDVKVVQPAESQRRYSQEEVDRAFKIAQGALALMRADQTPGDIGLLAAAMVAECGISSTVIANGLDEEGALGLVAWFAKLLGEGVLEARRRDSAARKAQEEAGLS